MADRIVQLVDKNDDNIYPVTTADGPTITVTSTDPGAGSSLAANHFVAVTGSGTATVGSADLASNSVTTAKIADGAVTPAKIDFTGWPFVSNVISSDTTFGNGNTVASVTVPADGTYLVLGVFSAPGGTSYSYLGLQIYLGSTQKFNTTQDMGSNGNRANVCGMAVITATTGQTLSVKVVLGASAKLSTGSGIFALKIG